jgi:hypothetical protein
MNLIDKTSKMRPYKGGLYLFVITYTNGVIKSFTAPKKTPVIKSVNKQRVESLLIDLAF